MSKIKNTAITAFLFAFGTIVLNAQGGSNYSALGIGDIFQTNAYYEGMGGASVANPSTNSINMKNPAMWSIGSTTRLQTGYKFNQHYVSSDKNSLYQNNGQINGVFALFSIDTGYGLSISAGLAPYSSINYYVSTPINVDNGDIITGANDFRGSGGITSAYLGTSFKLIDNLTLGVEGHVLFGKMSYSALTYINDGYSYYYLVNKQDFTQGFGYKTGLYYTGFGNLGIGLYYENASKVSVDRDSYYYIGTSVDTVKSSFDINMPASYGLGVSYLTGKFIMAADLIYKTSKDMNYNIGTNTKFRNTIQFAAGINRVGNTNRSEDFLDKISYKFGFGYKQLYYTINNQNINELYLTTGAQIPISNAGIIDVGLVIGKRGTENSGLVSEYFGRMFFDLSIGEIWFKPFKRQY